MATPSASASSAAPRSWAGTYAFHEGLGAKVYTYDISVSLRDGELYGGTIHREGPQTMGIDIHAYAKRQGDGVVLVYDSCSGCGWMGHDIYTEGTELVRLDPKAPSTQLTFLKMTSITGAATLDAVDTTRRPKSRRVFHRCEQKGAASSVANGCMCPGTSEIANPCKEGGAMPLAVEGGCWHECVD
jgi:hypothetical protein